MKYVRDLVVRNGGVVVITLGGETIIPKRRCHTIHCVDTGTEENPDGDGSVLPKYDPQTQRFCVETEVALRELRKMMAFCASNLGIVDKLPTCIREAVVDIITPKKEEQRMPKSQLKPVFSCPSRVTTANQATV